MKTYRGGQMVEPGIYCSLRSGEMIQAPGQGTVLRGEDTTRYIRLPVILVLIAGPLVGLGFVVFLPVIGIVGLAAFVAHRLGRRLWPVARVAYRWAGSRWAGMVSHLARARSGKQVTYRETQETLPKAIK